MLQPTNSQMTRKYCVILITNHSFLKNDISRNQDQSANDSQAVGRIKFIACIIWSECFDQFTIKSWFPLATEEGGNQSHLYFSHNLGFFQLNTDIKNLSYQDSLVSSPVLHTVKCQPHWFWWQNSHSFSLMSENWFVLTHWGTINYLPISLRDHFKRIYLRCCSLRISYLEACDTSYSSLCLNTFHSISSCFYSREEMDRSLQLAMLSECVRPKGS